MSALAYCESCIDEYDLGTYLDFDKQESCLHNENDLFKKKYSENIILNDNCIISNNTTYTFFKSYIKESKVNMKDNLNRYMKDIAENFENITLDDESMQNQPILKGTKIPVTYILTCLKDEISIGEISSTNHLSRKQIKNSIDFAIAVLKDLYDEKDFDISKNDEEYVVQCLKLNNLRKIMNMKKFKNNWNGNGGLPFSRESILFYKKLIENIIKQPEIAPTGRGSLLMQYEFLDGSVLAFEVFDYKASKVYIPKRNYSEAVEEEINNNILDSINKNLEMYYGQRYNS